MTIVRSIRDELANILEPAFDMDAELLAAGIKIQVSSRRLVTPSSFAVDIWPGTPFSEGLAAGFVGGSGEMHFQVRVRIVGDIDALQDMTDRLLSPDDNICVQVLLESDQSLNGVASSVMCAPPNGPAEFIDPGQDGAMEGYIWDVTVLPVLT